MNPQGSVRMIGGALAAAGVAVLLHLPWSPRPRSGRTPRCRPSRASPERIRSATSPALLRFEVGPLGSAPLGWCFLVAAALPLLIARAERHAWAVRGWTLAVVSFGIAWAAQRGTCPCALPAVDVLLVPAAAGLALATAMGVRGLRGRPAGLPVRVAADRVGAGGRGRRRPGSCRSSAPSFDGRWSMPAGDHTSALGVHRRRERRDALPRALAGRSGRRCPLGGWALEDGLAYGTTDDGAPDAREPLGGLRRRPHRPARRRPRPGPHGPDRPPRPAPGPDGRPLRRRARAAGAGPVRDEPISPCRRRSRPPSRRSSTSSRSTCPPG